MDNEMYKKHGFFYMYMCVNVIVHFVMGLVILIHHKKYTYLCIIQLFICVHSIHRCIFLSIKVHGHVRSHNFEIQ
jgi:hypothetical protein